MPIYISSNIHTLPGHIQVGVCWPQISIKALMTKKPPITQSAVDFFTHRKYGTISMTKSKEHRHCHGRRLEPTFSARLLHSIHRVQSRFKPPQHVPVVSSERSDSVAAIASPSLTGLPKSWNYANLETNLQRHANNKGQWPQNVEESCQSMSA